MSSAMAIIIVVVLPAFVFLLLQVGALSTRVKRLEEIIKSMRGKVANKLDPIDQTPPVIPYHQAKPEPEVSEQPTPPSEYQFRDKEVESKPELKSSSFIDSILLDISTAINSQALVRFFSVNPIAKIGMIVLFIGVAFLLKFVTIYFYIPISYRFIAAGLLGASFMLGGQLLFSKSKLFAGVLVGGGASILYLTIFTAYQMYGLISPVSAMVLLIAVVMINGILAVHRDVMELMVMSSIGGFLAPLIIQTGATNALVLFGYYLILNIAITAIVSMKKWHELTMIGFVFTFIVSALWQGQQYEAALFMQAELFLIAFSVLYIANTLVMRYQLVISRFSVIELALLFATPVVFFILQTHLVLPYEYGQAFSALALAGFYACLAFVAGNNLSLKMLKLPFNGIALTFLTLSIPLFFSVFWVFNCWALEAVLLIWYANRSSHKGLEVAGLAFIGLVDMLVLIPIYGMVSGVNLIFDPSTVAHTQTNIVVIDVLLAGFLRMIDVTVNALVSYDTLPLWKIYFNSVATALANIISAYFIFSSKRKVDELKVVYEIVLLTVGAILWYEANLYDIYNYTDVFVQPYYLIFFVATTHLFAWIMGEILSWPLLRKFGLYLLPVMVIIAMPTFGLTNVHSSLIVILWFYAFASLYFILYRDERYSPVFNDIYHVVAYIFLTVLLVYRVMQAVDFYHMSVILPDFVIAGIVPGLMLTLLTCTAGFLRWPFRVYEKCYQWRIGSILAGYLFVWLLVSNLMSGYLTRVAYIPIVNVLDLSITAVLFIFYNWFNEVSKNNEYINRGNKVVCHLLIAALVFTLINAVLLRSFSAWDVIPYTLNALWHSIHIQTALSVLWAIIALMVTFTATRHGQRVWWFAGFLLIGLVVIKLFLVDLSNSNTLERVITFMVVGLLLLLIGYLSPLPPKDKIEDK